MNAGSPEILVLFFAGMLTWLLAGAVSGGVRFVAGWERRSL